MSRNQGINHKALKRLAKLKKENLKKKVSILENFEKDPDSSHICVVVRGLSYHDGDLIEVFIVIKSLKNLAYQIWAAAEFLKADPEVFPHPWIEIMVGPVVVKKMQYEKLFGQFDSYSDIIQINRDFPKEFIDLAREFIDIYYLKNKGPADEARLKELSKILDRRYGVDFKSLVA